jgi:hypothetical protein
MLLPAWLAICVEYRCKNPFCTNFTSPCDYDTAIETINSGSPVIVLDRSIFETIHLNSFSTFFWIALSKGAILNGWNIIVNGTQTEDLHPALMSLHHLESEQLHKFTFIQFRVPVFHGRNVARTLLSDIGIDRSDFDGPISLLTVGGDNSSLLSVSVGRTVVHDASLLFVRSSEARFFRMAILIRFLCHMSNVPLIALYNANTTFTNTVFARNASLHSPLFKTRCVSFASGF